MPDRRTAPTRRVRLSWKSAAGTSTNEWDDNEQRNQRWRLALHQLLVFRAVTGGEVPAMCLLEAVVRLLPGVLGNDDSAREESFSDECHGLLEYPHYTRPLSFRGLDVPEVLRSGDHAKIKRYREEQARLRSAERRPELLAAQHAKKGES